MIDKLEDPGLLDARLLLLDDIISDEDFYIFTDFLSKISSNDNIKISSESKKWLMLKYQEMGFPESNERIPVPVRSTLIAAINRIQYGENIYTEKNERTANLINFQAFSDKGQDYTGCLISDLSSFFDWRYYYIVTDRKFWSDVPIFDPSKFNQIEFITVNPAYELDNLDEVEQKIKSLRYASSKFIRKSIFIFGGKSDDKILRNLSIFCNVNPSDIRWVESEKNKKSKNFKSAYRKLSSEKNLAILYAGKVGHGESIPFKIFVFRTISHLYFQQILIRFAKIYCSNYRIKISIYN